MMTMTTMTMIIIMMMTLMTTIMTTTLYLINAKENYDNGLRQKVTINKDSGLQ
jgi:uncharacterized membrane protein (DUF485 family)